MSRTTINRPSLRLAAQEGRRVTRGGRPVKPLTDEQARDAMVDYVRDMVDELPRGSRFRRNLIYVLAELDYWSPSS